MIMVLNLVKRRNLQDEDTIKTLEDWKPIDSWHNLNDNDKMYIKIINELKEEVQKKYGRAR